MPEQTYKARELTRVLDNGPAPDEDWFRLKVMGESETYWLNITAAQLRAIIDTLSS